MGREMSRFLDALHSGRVLLMDGAMGTELQRVELQPGECGELWNRTRPDQVLAIHQAYASAGAEVFLTNTFLANPSHLSAFGLEDRLEELNSEALRLARKTAGRSGFVLGDVGPLLHEQQVVADYKEIGRILTSLDGVDGFLFETWSSPRALSAVQYAFHRVAEVDTPLLLSLTYLRSRTGSLVTHSGHTPETYARHAERHGVAALGVNCGRDIGMDDMLEIIQRYRQVTDLPLFVRPNAGTPTKQGDHWIYPHSPESMAARLPELLEVGVSMVGGCCGTTPAHLAAFRPVLAAWNRKR
jgi:5-methyltetrahydrofolate--homocysteine methyltransferase